MMPTENVVRQIVREELRDMLMSVQGAAQELDRPYETPELDSRAFQAVAEVAREAGRPLHTNEACPRRTYYSNDACICGADKEKKETQT